MILLDTNIIAELCRRQPAPAVDRCRVFPITEAVARCAGTLRGQLRAAGETRTQADMLIAATAQVHQLELATRNVRDFRGCGLALLDPFDEPSSGAGR